MNDNHRLRMLLVERPRLTAEEIGEALGWTDVRTRYAIAGLVRREEGASLPKRYELTPLGERRVNAGGRLFLTPEQRKQKSIQRVAAFRERQKAKKEDDRRAREEAERKEALAANDGMVAQAKANRPALDMVWGGWHA